jgi:hypothetical protein
MVNLRLGSISGHLFSPAGKPEEVMKKQIQCRLIFLDDAAAIPLMCHCNLTFHIAMKLKYSYLLPDCAACVYRTLLLPCHSFRWSDQ